MKCDGAHDIDVDSLHEYKKEFISDFEKSGGIHKAGFLEFLSPEQEYKKCPVEYKESVHWSITGACNFKCRHCFMSAPHAKHGAPTHEQIINIADSLARCGIHQVGLTGGSVLDEITLEKYWSIAEPTVFRRATGLSEAEEYRSRFVVLFDYDGKQYIFLWSSILYEAFDDEVIKQLKALLKEMRDKQ